MDEQVKLIEDSITNEPTSWHIRMIGATQHVVNDKLKIELYATPSEEVYLYGGSAPQKLNAAEAPWIAHLIGQLLIFLNAIKP